MGDLLAEQAEQTATPARFGQTLGAPRPKRSLIALACLLGLTVSGTWWVAFVPYFFLRGNNDFVSAYAGASLAGSGKLYDLAAVSRAEAPLGDSRQLMVFPRFPYYAALLSPLRWLSYRTAYWTWQCISLAAVLAFVAFWPAPQKWITLVACCWSLPLAACFIMGQDTTLVMAALAVSLALFFRGRHFAAGLAISLCSIKFQLFLTLPLLILTRRWWRFGGGLAAGGAALLGISFAVEGRTWPVQYVQALRTPILTPSFGLMPNLNGLFAGQPHAALLAGIGACVVLAAAWVVMFRGESADAFTAMLVGGLLLSYHAFIQDAAILVPAGLLLIFSQTRPGYRLVGLILLSPLAFLTFRMAHPPYRSAAILLLALVALAIIPAVQRWWRPLRLPAAAPGRTGQRADGEPGVPRSSS